MTPLPRIRRHADDRVALCFESESDQDHWRIFEERPRYCFSGSIIGPLGEGWSELFVAELPEPDYELSCVEVWDLHTGELTVDHTQGGELETPHLHTVDRLRSDALKMLATATACERYRAEREATNRDGADR